VIRGLLLLSLLAPVGWGQTGFDAVAKQAAAAREAARLEEALGLYRKAVQLRPRWAEGWWYVGTLLYDRNEYAEAARAFKRAAALSPKDGTPLVMLGLCERELGRDDEALAHITQGNRIGIAQDPHLRDVVLYAEAALLQSKGKFEGAQEKLEALCLSGKQSTALNETLGMTVLRMARRKAPDAGTAGGTVVRRVGEAQCLGGRKEFDQAKRWYESVVAEHPDFPNIHYAYGRFLIQAGEAAAGIEALKREIVKQPSHAMARLQIAAAQYKVDSAAGLPFAEEAVRIDPGIPMGHYLLGLLLLDTNDHARAIPELELARKAFPGEARVHLALGAAYARAGRQADAARARAEFQKLNQNAQAPTVPEPR
jgi:tetratricopeptide (TPR) repeat protein